jgi:catechol 2,3-dioxygenase
MLDKWTNANSTLRLPEEARMGAVNLRVSRLDRALVVWRDLIGLTVLSRSEQTAHLGAGGRTLIVLQALARWPAPSHSLGLYHVAIRIPTRRDFARTLARLHAAHYRNAPTDHLVTQTTYLSDADGNGIELMLETFERGRAEVVEGRFRMSASDGSFHSGREPLELKSLFSKLEGAEDLGTPLPPGTDIGHVHLHVSDLDETMAFYADAVGFKPHLRAKAAQMYDVGLGANPHAVAFNTWAGTDVNQAAPDAAGLDHFTVEVPTATVLAEVAYRLAIAGAPVECSDGSLSTADPSGNRLKVLVA